MYTDTWKFYKHGNHYVGGSNFSPRQAITHYAEVPRNVSFWEFSINYNHQDTIVGFTDKGEDFEVTIKQWK